MAVTYSCDDAGLDSKVYDEQGVQLHLAAALIGNGAATRGGKILRSNAAPYVLNSGLVGTLRAGPYVVQLAAARGAALVWLDQDVDLTHPTASGTQPRTDLIIAEVAATGTSGTSFKRVRIVQGIADVSGSAPDPTTNWAAPISGSPGDSGVAIGNGGWVVIARVRVNASATTLSTIAFPNLPVVAAGGITPVDGAIGTPSLAAGLPPGSFVWDDTVKAFARRDSGSGLVRVDSRPQVKYFDLLRSSVPSTGEEVVGKGYRLTFTYNAGVSTPVVPPTTQQDSNTTLIIGQSGWYRIGGIATTHEFISALSSTTVITSVDGGTSWSTQNLQYTQQGFVLQFFVPTDVYLAAGTFLQVFVSRTTSTTGDIGGRMTLTLIRSAV